MDIEDYDVDDVAFDGTVDWKTLSELGDMLPHGKDDSDMLMDAIMKHLRVRYSDSMSNCLTVRKLYEWAEGNGSLDKPLGIGLGDGSCHMVVEPMLLHGEELEWVLLEDRGGSDR